MSIDRDKELLAAATDMSDALEAVLLFYASGPWTVKRVNLWRALTGTSEATTKNLCDAARAARDAFAAALQADEAVGQG